MNIKIGERHFNENEAENDSAYMIRNPQESVYIARRADDPYGGQMQMVPRWLTVKFAFEKELKEYKDATFVGVEGRTNKHVYDNG